LTSPAKPHLKGRVALVTGASRGIGYQLAKQLAGCGAHVIAVARTVGGLEELDDEIQKAGGSATLVPLDLKDMDGIDRLGGAINERWGKLDILFANAGMLGVVAPLGHVEAKVFAKVMEINVTATWRLMRTTDTLLRASGSGRAVVLTCDAGLNAPAFLAPYAASKAAVNALARSWAAESKAFGLHVNAVNPGPTRTALRALAMPGEDPRSVADPAEIASRMMFLADPALAETGRLYDVPQQRFRDWLHAD
jgi:NAD(P)-dependent dehydrogenase (short-subunit alcohol dehydrogenase family)